MRKFFTVCGLLALMALLGWWSGSPRSSTGTGAETPRVSASPAPVATTKGPQVPRPTAKPAGAAPAEAPGQPVAEVDGAITAFDLWAQRYLKADAEERKGLEAEGIRLAAARRPVMKELIKEDPRQALASAVPMVTRQQLPAAILSHLERRVNQRAAVTVYQGMPPPGAPLPAPGKTLTHRIAQLADEGAFNLLCQTSGGLGKKAARGCS